jgi:hypothetical protein
MTDERPLQTHELRCPSCNERGAYIGATTCARCDTALVSLPTAAVDGPVEPVFVYRRSVMVLMAIAAVGFPFLPLPFLDDGPGFVVKLGVTGAMLKIIRDYRETMRS